MGRRTTRRPVRRQEVNRPSTFFLAALAIGLILFIILVVMIIRHPPQQVGARIDHGAPHERVAGSV